MTHTHICFCLQVQVAYALPRLCQESVDKSRRHVVSCRPAILNRGTFSEKGCSWRSCISFQKSLDFHERVLWIYTITHKDTDTRTHKVQACNLPSKNTGRISAPCVLNPEVPFKYDLYACKWHSITRSCSIDMRIMLNWRKSLMIFLLLSFLMNKSFSLSCNSY